MLSNNGINMLKLEIQSFEYFSTRTCSLLVLDEQFATSTRQVLLQSAKVSGTLHDQHYSNVNFQTHKRDLTVLYAQAMMPMH